jgi:penicillin-binding protein 1A
MAGAYATIANGGVYIEPTFYIKVEDQNGNVIMKAEQETHRVLSEQNAWIVQSLLTEPTGTGLTGSDGATGTRARVTGMQTCGKTGTTNDTTATWFCGFTPYYSAAMYFGFDEPQDGGSKVPGSSTVASRWGTIMNKIHKGLSSSSFTKPSGIVTASICKDSGLLATSECEQDQRGSRVYTEYYAKGTTPTHSCTTHVTVKICKETGKIANEYCKEVEDKVFITRPNSDTDTSWQQAADAEYMAPTENCDVHNSSQDTEKPVITIKDVTKDTIEIKVNDKFSIPTATATDNIDGDISKNITTQIKKDGEVVEKIDTSKAGTYTITYTVEDAAKNTATKTITLKITDSDDKTTNTVTTNTVTNTVTSNTVSNTVSNTLTQNSVTNTEQ